MGGAGIINLFFCMIRYESYIRFLTKTFCKKKYFRFRVVFTKNYRNLNKKIEKYSF